MATRPTHATDSDDAPTQALDRDALRATLANAIDHARMAQRTVAVVMVVLARPDRLDALFGLPTRVLMDAALERLPGALRPVDRYVVLSDEKFAVLLPNLRSGAQAWLAAAKIQQALEAPYLVEGAESHVRPVAGIACYPEHADSGEELLVHADIAKRIARSRDIGAHVFQREDRRDVDVYLGLEAELREAIRANQLEVHYQPKVDLKSGQCKGVEALLRWNPGGRGAISPQAAVRVAEASRLMGPLTSWVLNTALRNQADWRRGGLALDVAVNLSTLTLLDAELVDMVRQALGTWEAPPGSLTLEITESATVADSRRSIEVMQKLKGLGLRLAADDFGTGHSSLTYVKDFPLDELKIDMSFVRHMRKSKGDQQIVRSVIDLAHNFELIAVAEGVEDEATYKDLRKMGCDQAQGFAFSPALTAAAVRDWIAGRNA